jgi:hypothetical protein
LPTKHKLNFKEVQSFSKTMFGEELGEKSFTDLIKLLHYIAPEVEDKIIADLFDKVSYHCGNLLLTKEAEVNWLIKKYSFKNCPILDETLWNQLISLAVDLWYEYNEYKLY